MATMESEFNYISELSMGYWKSQALIVAVDLGIFTRLHEKEASAAVIAKSLKTDKRATELLLNSLVGLELLTKQGNSFSNTECSERFLVEKQPMYQGYRILLSRNLWDNWTNLRKAVKTGKPVAFVNAKKKADPKRRNIFISSMHDFATFKSKLIAAKLDLSGRRKLLDLGGGPGTYSVEFVKTNPELEAMVFDLKNVLTITRRFLKKAGTGKRVKTIEGECLSDDYGKNLYDVVFISNLLHMYDEKVCMQIIKKCKTALTSKGLIVIHDFMLDSTMTQSPFSAIFSLNMLLGTHGGRNYSVEEYKTWLKKAGFEDNNDIQIDKDSILITGVKK